MNIEVGEYIRTKNGVIAQLEYIHDKDEVYWFDKVIYSRYGEEIDFLTTEELPKYVVSHSKNIIDLIEVGDYVNGHKINKKYVNSDNILCFEIEGEETIVEVKSIVTKQQFEGVKYEIK